MSRRIFGSPPPLLEDDDIAPEVLPDEEALPDDEPGPLVPPLVALPLVPLPLDDAV